MRGFSLLELIVAFMVLVYVFAGVMYLFPTTRQTLNQSRETLLADHLCRSQLEQATSLAQSGSFVLLVTTPPPLPTQTLTCTVNGVTQKVTFQYQRLVTDVTPQLKDVESVVTWTSGRLQRHVSLKTMVTRN